MNNGIHVLTVAMRLKNCALLLYPLNFNLFCNDNACFRIFAWSATLSTSLS